MLTPALCCVAAAVSLMALKFIAIFGIMGIPIFISLATCNEVRSCHVLFTHCSAFARSFCVVADELFLHAGCQAICEAQALQHAECPPLEVR